MKTVLSSLLFLGMIASQAGCQPADKGTNTMKPEIKSSGTNAPTVTKTDEEWRKILTPEQYRVLRQAGTERAFGPAYEEFKKQGEGKYVCGGCGAELFSSKEKFDSHCGWPSFYEASNSDSVTLIEDRTHGMLRTEVRCAACDSHLGHVFPDAPQTPTGDRFCINSVSLTFDEAE